MISETENLSDLASQFENEGYIVVKRLFSPEEVKEIGKRFNEIHNDGISGVYEPSKCQEAIDKPEDPLNKFPRVPQPHCSDELSKRYLLHPKVNKVLTEIPGEEGFRMLHCAVVGARTSKGEHPTSMIPNLD